MPQCPESFANVTAVCKANVYFDGKVVSHTILLEGGEKKTLGLIYPGAYNFGTGLPERMDVVAGACCVKLAGAADWTEYAAGTYFQSVREAGGATVLWRASGAGDSERRRSRPTQQALA